MSRRSSSPGPAAGMSLIEVLVSLGLLAIVLIMASQLLFATQRAARRQSASLEARQTARLAADYATYMLRGATDHNAAAGNPLAIVVWIERGTDPAYQTTYNNLTAAQAAAGFGDEGTDLLTFARADSAYVARLRHWNGYQAAMTAYWEFGLACPDSAENLRLFEEYTGMHPDPRNPNQTISDPITIVDASGQYAFYQITEYKEQQNRDNCQAVTVPPPDANCPDGLGCMAVVANPGRTDMLNAPGASRNLVMPVQMMLGVRYYSLRIKDGWLEQKAGMFDPADPDTGFTRLLPAVDDLQVAWIYEDGTVWNNSPGHQLSSSASCTSCTTNVPSQGTTDPYDVSHVIGLQLTVSGSSSQLISGAETPRLREAAADHPAATQPDGRFHFQLTTNALLRNRALGS